MEGVVFYRLNSSTIIVITEVCDFEGFLVSLFPAAQTPAELGWLRMEGSGGEAGDGEEASTWDHSLSSLSQ